MSILKCILCLAVICIVGFIAGRPLSLIRFNTQAFPFRLYEFEQSGKLYEKLSIKKWQNKLPDMSRLFAKLMPKKELTECTEEKLIIMINETCVAELTHIVLALSGFWCIIVCGDIFSVICSVLYFVGNIRFVMIQRYNRPRLERLLRKKDKGEKSSYANADTELQHR